MIVLRREAVLLLFLFNPNGGGQGLFPARVGTSTFYDSRHRWRSLDRSSRATGRYPLCLCPVSFRLLTCPQPWLPRILRVIGKPAECDSTCDALQAIFWSRHTSLRPLPKGSTLRYLWTVNLDTRHVSHGIPGDLPRPVCTLASPSHPSSPPTRPIPPTPPSCTYG